MSVFAPGFDFLLTHEDRSRSFKETVDNNGGRVIAGVNSKSWPIEFSVIQSGSLDTRPVLVGAFYREKFWNPLKLSFLDFQDVANRVLDMAVNSGLKEAVLLLQRACNALSPGSVTVDGLMGASTLSAVNKCDPEGLLSAYRDNREAYYRAVVEKHPEYASDLNGWLVRARA